MINKKKSKSNVKIKNKMKQFDYINKLIINYKAQAIYRIKFSKLNPIL